MVSKLFMLCANPAAAARGTRGRQDQEARSHRSATGGKYVIGNVEENGKKYRDSPEKTRCFGGDGLLRAVLCGDAESSDGCVRTGRRRPKNNRLNCGIRRVAAKLASNERVRSVCCTDLPRRAV
ncbi:hypothetical protein [Burkholderia latens]|uniref:hypothetical protein n=1 Tax=Burkholderia latens TaxID=488446 RepID=UPI00158985F1|nr:hypothetical protein [Burkholderia latens]